MGILYGYGSFWVFWCLSCEDVGLGVVNCGMVMVCYIPVAGVFGFCRRWLWFWFWFGFGFGLRVAEV